MNTKYSIIALLGTACLLTPLHAESFFRASAEYVHFQNAHYADKPGAALAGGIYIGERNEHELSVELEYSKWTYTDQPGSPILGAAWTSGSGRLVPLLVNYRYILNPNGTKCRIYIGPSLGLTNIRGDMSYSLSGLRYTGRINQWNSTISGVVGVQVPVSSMASIDIGYRYLQTSGVSSNLTAGSSFSHSVDLGDVKAHVATIGLSVNF